jgi:hypothetical protein
MHAMTGALLDGRKIMPAGDLHNPSPAAEKTPFTLMPVEEIK